MTFLLTLTDHGPTMRILFSNRLGKTMLLLTFVAGAVAAPVTAQQADVDLLQGSSRAMVTRDELTRALALLEGAGSGAGYTAAVGKAREAEIAAIRDRLAKGDLRNGDQVRIEVIGHEGASGTFTVSPDRKLLFPNGVEISVEGVLRSELNSHLERELARYIREPRVRAFTAIRLSLFGGVGKPGFYAAPANALLSDVIQVLGGGPANGARFEKSRVLRGEEIVVVGETFQRAITEGLTLDQLNLQAGDRIEVDVKPAGGTLFRAVGAVSALGSLVWLGIQIF